MNGTSSVGTTTLRTTWSSALARSVTEQRWNSAFVGLLFYLLVEYTRLPAMFPALVPFRLGKIAIGLAVLGYLIAPRARGNRRLAAGGIDLAILVFVLGSLVSACLAYAAREELVWDGFLDVLGWGMIYFLITRILINSWRLRIFTIFLLLLNLKLAQFAVRQYFAERAKGSSDIQIIMGGGSGAGSTGFFGNAADFGLAMCVVWGIAWALLLAKTQRKLLRIFLIVCFTLFLLAILLCGSRGAVVGAAAIVLAAFGRTPRKIGTVMVALVFLISIWFVLPDASKERFRSAWDWENDANATSRILFWRSGLSMFWEHPVFGVGPDNFGQTYAMKYSFEGIPEVAYAAHSLYIQALAESGLVGTASLLALLVLILRRNARTRKLALTSCPAGLRSFEYCLALGLDLALVGYLTSGAFLSVLYYPHLWILLGLSVAANTACTNKRSGQQAAELQSQKRDLVLAAS